MKEEEIIASVLQEVLDALPPHLREKLENMEFIVQERAEGYQRFILGLYHGVPLPKRGLGYTFTLPDRIVIYAQSIRRVAPQDAEFRQKVKEVILHEIGHYFGFSEQDLARLLGGGG
ncbi:MAG: metallopeptidase family protein [Candidatus Caldatribacteriaceae bacterium]